MKVAAYTVLIAVAFIMMLVSDTLEAKIGWYVALMLAWSAQRREFDGHRKNPPTDAVD